MIFFLLWVVVGIPIAFCFLMYSHPKAEKGINIAVISTSEIKISVLIEDQYTELAVRALHTAYDLDAL